MASSGSDPTNSTPPAINIADDLERLFSKVVRRHPILYNRAHKFHNSTAFPAAHNETWNRISTEMRLEVSSCKSLWSCIKQKFIKYRKCIANGEAVSKEWPLYEPLFAWLDEHIQRRRSRIEMCKQIRTGSASATPTGQQQQHQVASSDDTTGADANLLSFDHQDLMDSVDTADWSELPDEPASTTTTPPSPAKKIPRTEATFSNKRKLVVTSSSNLAATSNPTPSCSEPQPKRQLKIEICNVSTAEVKDDNDDDDDDVDDNTAGGVVLLPRVVAPPTVLSRIAESTFSSRLLSSSVAVRKPVAAIERNIVAPTVKQLQPTAVLSAATAAAAAAAAAEHCYTGSATTLANTATASATEASTASLIDFDRLERAIGKCISMAEQCSVRQRMQDPDEVFGTLIASMVRELPADRRRNARVQILHLAGDLLAKLA